MLVLVAPYKGVGLKDDSIFRRQLDQLKFYETIDFFDRLTFRNFNYELLLTNMSRFEIEIKSNFLLSFLLFDKQQRSVRVMFKEVLLTKKNVRKRNT